MDSGFFDVLHDATKVKLLAVVQCVDVDFHSIVEEAINKQWGRDSRSVGLFRFTPSQILLQLGTGEDDLHAATTEHI